MQPDNPETAERDIEKHIISDSYHLDYFHLAIEAYGASRQETQKQWYLPRHIIDTILYSYTCLEASVEYIYRCITEKQFSQIEIPDTWVAKYLSRKWGGLSLGDKIGMMTYAWTTQNFWKHPKQYLLFLNLETIRDGLIHLRLYKWVEVREVFEREKIDNNTESFQFKLLSHDIHTKDFLVNRTQSIAQFHNNPRELNLDDAQQALEIMIRILLQLEDTFCMKGRLAYIYDTETQKVRYGEQLVQDISCRFENVWRNNK